MSNLDSYHFIADESYRRKYKLLPFGEVDCDIDMIFTPETDYDDHSVRLTGSRIYSNGRYISLDSEETYNLHPLVEEHCCEWALKKYRAILADQKEDAEAAA